MRGLHAILTSVAALLVAALIAGVCFVEHGRNPVVPDAGGVEREHAAGGASGAEEPAPVRRERAAERSPRWTGRCVDWRSGRALGGCRVTIDGVVACTDPDGCFAIAGEALGDGDGDVDIGVDAPGHLGVRRSTTRRSSRDLGDVRLRPATYVRGVVLDDDERPCVDVEVLAFAVDHVSRDDGWLEPLTLRARTNGDGTFAFPTPLPPGHLQLSAPALVDVRGDTDLQLRVAEPAFAQLRCRAWGDDDVIAGRVESHDGLPVASAVVVATVDGVQVDAARADEHGWFRMIRRRGAPEAVELVANDLRDARGGEGALAAVRWGQRDVRVRLAAPAGALVEVVDAATGAPIEDYALQCVAIGGLRSSSSGARSHDGRHERGRCLLADVAVGRHRLIVWPQDARWLPGLPKEFRVDGRGCTTVRVALPRAATCPVQVVDERGDAVVGATVELLAPAENDIVRDLAELFANGGSNARVNVRLATARSDANGVAGLRWFADPQPLQLRVFGDGVAARIVSDVQLAGGAVRVVVERAGTLELHLEGAAGHLVTLHSRRGERVEPPTWRPDCTLDAAGAAVMTVPAGEWSVRLHARDCGVPIALPAPSDGSPLAHVLVEAGRRVTVRADAMAMTARAAVCGHALVDGAPAAAARLQFGERRDGDVRVVGARDVAVDARGAFVLEDLPAVLCRPCVLVSCAGRSVAVPQGEWRALRGGERLDVGVLTVTTTRVRLRVARAGGADAPRGLLALRSTAGVVLAVPVEGGPVEGGPVEGGPVEGAVVELDRVPLGSYRAQWRTASQAVELGALEVGPGAVVERSFELP